MGNRVPDISRIPPLPGRQRLAVEMGWPGIEVSNVKRASFICEYCGGSDFSLSMKCSGCGAPFSITDLSLSPPPAPSRALGPPPPPSDKLSPSGPEPRMIIGMTVPNFWLFVGFITLMLATAAGVLLGVK